MLTPKGKEYHGHWVGVSENHSNFMRYKILTDDTLKVIHHSNICLAHDPKSKNLCQDPLNDDTPKVIKYLPHQVPPNNDCPSSDHGETSLPSPSSNDDSTSSMAIVDPQDLVGHTFLMDEREDGQRFCARIVEYINEHEEGCNTNEEHIKFR